MSHGLCYLHYDRKLRGYTGARECKRCGKEYKADSRSWLCRGCRASGKCFESDCNRKLFKARKCHTHYKDLVLGVRYKKCAKKTCAGLVRVGPRGGRVHCDEHYRPSEWSDTGHASVNSDGYVTIRVGGRICREHTLVMEAVVGRKLLLGENVHHINGIRDDNRPENLELWNTSQPKGQRVSDKIAWAKEFLEEYGYTVEPPTSD